MVHLFSGGIFGPIVTIAVTDQMLSPQTKDDIKTLSKRMGYYSEVDFIKKETIISSWAQKESSGRLENTHTYIFEEEAK